MGRELRKVPANWEHPKDERGHYIPLLGRSFSKSLAEWEEGKAQWEKVFRDDWNGGWKEKEPDEMNITWEEWTDEKPKQEDYMPEWNESELTHIQLYETTTEGTPNTPVFPKKQFEQLCEYAAEHCSTFADFKATKEEWMQMLSDGFVSHQEGNVIFM